MISLIDNEGLEIGYGETWGKQIRPQGDPGKNALKHFSGLLGKADPLKKLGKTKTEAEEDNTELIKAYDTTMRPSHAVLGATAGGSLMAGPPKNSIFYDTFNTGIPEDILFGIGAIAGTGIIALQRYDSGKREKLGQKIKERRADELVNRFGEYRITEN